MPWLEQLDVNVFRFINGTLSNPVLDKIMPFLSGNAFFAPALVVLAAALIWKGRERGLICVLMMGLAVGTGDGLICRTIKHAVQRPRPFSALPDVKRPGKTANPKSNELNGSNELSKEAKRVETKGTAPAKPTVMINTNSMPSAHAANWFAGTMVALIYYRKSIRIMLPLACLVSFSRVYNGVHYPSDVLAGAIIGAGHAAATVWLLNALWQWAGPKWFGQAWKKMPSLLQPPLSKRTQCDEPAPARIP
jgi:undecaprenyl-diphosphatase